MVMDAAYSTYGHHCLRLWIMDVMACTYIEQSLVQSNHTQIHEVAC